MRLRLPLGLLLTTALVVPTTVVLPMVAVGRVTPHPVAPHHTTLPLSGVDASALRSEPVPVGLVRRLEQVKGLSVGRAQEQAATLRPAVLTGREPTAGYSMLGVTWLPNADPVDLAISVRTRTGGVWGVWQQLDQLTDTASGKELAHSVRMATAPQWVGPSDGVQVRVDVLSGALPAGLRVDLIDPGTSAADAQVTQPEPPGAASAAAPMPNIITRAEWGADESLRDKHLAMSKTIKAAFIHHTAGSNDYTEAQAPSVVRGLLSYSTSIGYADIPYNFLVDKYGNIYEGRAGSITKPVRQGATGGFNTNTMSVSAMGNFVTHRAPDVMVHAIAEILAFRLSAYHLDPHGKTVLVAEDSYAKYPVGTKVTFNVISGHRDASNTACPGDRLYERLGDIRRQVARMTGANFVQPKASPSAVPYGDPSVVDVSAGALTDMSWTLTVTPACGTKPVRTIVGDATASAGLDVRWRGLDDAGRPVAAGRYTLTLTGGTSSSLAVPWSHRVQLQVGSPGSPPTAKSLPSTPSGRYVPLLPTRLMSTATGFGVDAPLLLGPDSRVQVPVLGRAGVPSDHVSAVAVNVLASCPSAATTVSVGPSQLPATMARAVSVDAGTTARGLAVSGVGPDGGLTVRNESGAVGVTLSVVGYWTTDGTGDGYVPVPPTAVPGTAKGLAVGRTPVMVPVAGTSGVPAGAQAVVVNVRRSASSLASAVWLWPSDGSRPAAADLQRGAGQTAQQRVLVPLGSDGALAVAANRSASVRLDVVGYLGSSGAGFNPVAPKRLTSSSLRLAADSGVRVAVGGVGAVPASADAVVLQLTGTGSSGMSRLVVYPAGTTAPSSADLTVAKGSSRTNLVVVPLGDRGRVRLLARAAAVDPALVVVGWLG